MKWLVKITSLLDNGVVISLTGRLADLKKYLKIFLIIRVLIVSFFENLLVIWFLRFFNSITWNCSKIRL